MLVMLRRATTRLSTAFAVAAMVQGCHDVSEVTKPNTAGTSRAYLTGAAAEALDAQGYFRLQPSVTWKRAQLVEAEAAKIAEVYIRKFAPTLPSYFERSHGATIAFASLVRCGRAFYGMTPYEEPASTVDEGTVNGVASQWFFTYCSADGLPTISVAVAATATHLKIENGQFTSSSRRGNEFSGTGIPRGTDLPISPERAVEMLFGASERPISAAPRLILPGVPYFPQSARWDLELATSANVRSASGQMNKASRFFVGRSLKDWKTEISRGVAKATESPTDAVVLASGQRLQFVRSEGMPRAWERVEFVGGLP